VTPTLASLLAVAVLTGLHLVAGKLRFLEGTPRSVWLSLAGGVSVAYVFVQLLPELSEGQEAVAEAAGEGLAFLENHVYLLSLLGLAVFYGLERAATTSRRRRLAGGGDAPSRGVFWLHVASFAAYNALTGYVLHQQAEDSGRAALALFAIAMGLHFVVNDYGLREHHKADYARSGRWALVATLLLGWAIGLAGEISEAALATLLAFLAGGVILNVLKEELPEERESRYWAFALGAAAYAALLLAL
jgi:zinc transporter ZupT